VPWPEAHAKVGAAVNIQDHHAEPDVKDNIAARSESFSSVEAGDCWRTAVRSPAIGYASNCLFRKELEKVDLA